MHEAFGTNEQSLRTRHAPSSQMEQTSGARDGTATRNRTRTTGWAGHLADRRHRIRAGTRHHGNGTDQATDVTEGITNVASDRTDRIGARRARTPCFESWSWSTHYARRLSRKHTLCSQLRMRHLSRRLSHPAEPMDRRSDGGVQRAERRSAPRPMKRRCDSESSALSARATR
jgi:hypothetical protein